jgi:hypothetical protein
MPVTKIDNTGEITTNFLLDDFTVYLMNTSSTGGYAGTDWVKIGFTSAEKTINVINEKYVREDKIPRIPTYTKTIRKGLEITSGLSNQNEDLLAMVTQGTKTDLGSSTGTRIAHGTSEADIEYRAIRFSSVRDDGVTYNITIPKCELTLSGEQTVGGESEVVKEILYKAIYNPSASNTANLYYENYWESAISVTADVPPGYA